MPAADERARSGMNRRRRIFLSLVACVAVGVVCFFMLRSSEPTYRDKSLSEWVGKLLEDSPRRDSEAREALRAMGQPAVRNLTRRVGYDPSPWRIRLAEMMENIPVAKDVFSVDTWDRLQAVHALAEIGPAAKAAIPALERLTNHVDLSHSLAARAALVRIRGESLESYVTPFRQFSTSNALSTNAVSVTLLLVYLGPYAMPVLPALLEGVRSTNEQARWLATWALSHVGCESPECLPTLLRLLSDPCPNVRHQALTGLAYMGPPAKTVMTNVRHCLQDTNGSVRLSALNYFDRVLSDDEFSAVRAEVVRATQDADSTVCQLAQYILSKRPSEKSTNAPAVHQANDR